MDGNTTFEIQITSFINGQFQKNRIENPTIKEFYFIEDIFSYSLTGKLVFEDVRGILEEGCLVANTDVWVLYGDGTVNGSDNIGYPILMRFKVYKINKITPSSSNKVSGQPNANTIELILVEPHFYHLINQRYSKSWKNTKVIDIIKDILINMVKWDEGYFVGFGLIDSKEKLDFVMSYWTPLQALNWLSQRASISNEYGFTVFNRTDWVQSAGFGGSSWGSTIKIDALGNMLKQTELLQDPGKGIFVLTSTALQDYNRIISYQFNSVDMYSERQIRGGHFLGYDFNRKKLIDEKYQYSEGDNNKNTLANNITTLGDWTLFKSTEKRLLEDQLIDTETKVTYTGEANETVIKNITLNNWVKSYCVQNALNIIVKGHESRRAGFMIEIAWPSNASETNTYNDNLYGNYLIKSVTHHFAPTNKPFYKQKMVLIKNAYNYKNVTDDILYRSTSTNIKTKKGQILG